MNAGFSNRSSYMYLIALRLESPRPDPFVTYLASNKTRDIVRPVHQKTPRLTS